MSDPVLPSPIERRLHTSQLAGFVSRLQPVFVRHGIPPDKINALVSSLLSASCVTCGIVLRGEELLQLASQAESPAPASPKLDRLRQGYCARTGCDSYFVNLTLQPGADVDWTKVLAEVESGAAPDPMPEATAPTSRPASPLQRKGVRIAVGLALVLVAFLIRQLVTHRSIPFIYEPQRFEADPATLPAQPPRPPS